MTMNGKVKVKFLMNKWFSEDFEFKTAGMQGLSLQDRIFVPLSGCLGVTGWAAVGPKKVSNVECGV